MNERSSLSWLVILAAVAACLFSAPLYGSAAEATPEPFRDGDRWCALGDSITHYGSYHQWVSLFYLTRFPTREISVYNCGISGDTAKGGVRRLDWDVLSREPTVVSIMFGMNDVGRELYGDNQFGMEVVQRRRERLAEYRQNMTTLVREIQEAGARAILITPSIYDQTAALETSRAAGVNDALAKCAEIAREIAAETGAALVDFHGPMTRANAALQKTNAQATVVGEDRIHPGAPGHFLMAYLFLKAQNLSGVVSRLAIDLNSNAVTAADNGRWANIVRDDNTLTFEWTENALPFPVDSSVASALAWAPFVEEFNQEILQIVGLRSGLYELDIDGDTVGSFEANELAAGINLANESSTPQYRQAVSLLRLVEARAELERDNLRGMAHVEHQAGPEIEHPVTLEQMRPFLQKRLEAFSRNPPAESTRLNVELYPRRKESETQTLASISRLERLARLAAVPRSHVYRLRRVR